jgi:hypothetical protein
VWMREGCLSAQEQEVVHRSDVSRSFRLIISDSYHHCRQTNRREKGQRDQAQQKMSTKDSLP